MIIDYFCSEKKDCLMCKMGSILKFHRLTLNSLPLIRPYLQNSNALSCDYTVGGIYMWIDYFKYHYCIYHDTLIIKGVAEDDINRTAFSLPLGKMPLAEAVDVLREYCKHEGMALEFSAITERDVERFNELNPREVYELKNWCDYLYDAEKFLTYAGNKMKKKRNHVNQFKNTYKDWSISAIDEGNIDEVKRFMQDVCNEKSDKILAEYERTQTRRVLDDYKVYRDIFDGIALRVAGNIVAIAIGEVQGNVLFIHIEKTNHEYDGATETLNQTFIEYMRSKCAFGYVNLEEDVGDEGLKSSKLSYHPEIVLRKYNVIFG